MSFHAEIVYSTVSFVHFYLWVKGSPRLRKIRQANQGQASARNNGIKQSSGKFICFLDSDDLFLPYCISERLKFFNNSAFQFIYNDFIVIDDNDKVINLSGIQWRNMAPLPTRCFRELFLNGTFINPSGIMLEKDILNRVGLFDETLQGAEDYDLWLRVSHDYAFGFVNLPLGKYRIHAQNFSNNTIVMEEQTAKAVLKAVKTFSDIEKLIGPKKMRDRVHQVCIDVAYNYLQRGDPKSARYWLKNAWQWGRKPKTLLQLMGTWCGPLMRKYQAREEVN